ncbi:hypothetical protein K474DRAFT_1664933 [Panus rudis PR-1116 ss-1]|nr:hypothetical protein K474DRAFT_1664933 [Panus rudis PR-1116 ss-1]
MTMNTLKTRKIGYGLITTLSVLQVLLSVVEGAAGILGIETIIILTCAGVTTIWMAILLATHNRPNSTHALTTARSHLIFLILIAVLWLALSILMIIVVSLVCPSTDLRFIRQPLRCGVNVPIVIFALCMFFIATGMSVFVYRKSTRAKEGSLSKNVAFADDKVYYEMDE